MPQDIFHDHNIVVLMEMFQLVEWNTSPLMHLRHEQ
jgi:hypothetical protein